MNVDSEKMELNVENTNIDIEIGSNDVEIEENVLRVFEKDHSKLKNLDYENSGHTGFASSEEIKKLNDKLENISSNASDISYEDTYDNDYTNVQEALDGALWTKEYILQNNVIGRLHNKEIDLSILAEGAYILTGKETTIKGKNGSSKVTHTGVIVNDEKLLLITIGDNNYSRAILYSYDNRYTGLSMRVLTGTSINTYSLLSLLTTGGSEIITGTKTFNAIPKCMVGPTINSHLTNKQYVDRIVRESKYATNLGYIDLDDYDGDVYAFMDTLINEGRYKFVDSYDEFEWYVEVYRTDYYAGQSYWGSEEGFANKYYRHGFYNEDEDIVEWQDWTNFLTWDMAISSFSDKSHFHYTTTSVADIRTWLDEQKHMAKSEYEVIQTSNNHKFTVKFNSTSYVSNGESFYIRYQEYYDIEEPNKIYKRSGRASNNTILATITWSDWYVFEENTDHTIQVNYNTSGTSAYKIEFFQNVLDNMKLGKSVIITTSYENANGLNKYGCDILTSPKVTDTLDSFTGTIYFKTPKYYITQQAGGYNDICIMHAYKRIDVVVNEGIVTSVSALYERYFNKDELPVLGLNNIREYTPTSNYNPATKKYVDDTTAQLDNVLKDILIAIQEGGTTSNTIEEIEQSIVSYFENKTVEEVEA